MVVATRLVGPGQRLKRWTEHAGLLIVVVCLPFLCALCVWNFFFVCIGGFCVHVS